MRLIVDENMSRAVIQTLRDCGHDVLSVKESMRGAVDADILARAQADLRLVVTQDKDFGELTFRFGLPADSGVILFRLAGDNPDADSRRILEVIESRSDWTGQFAVATGDRVRMRRLPPSGQYLNPGDIVRAKVTRVEVFGVFLDYLGHEILVTIPGTSWTACYASCEQLAEIGDEFPIRILAYQKDRNQYAGSMREVYSESDPWSGTWIINVGDTLEATVVRLVQKADRCGGKRGYLLELRPTAYVMLCGQDAVDFAPGQKCFVTVTEVDRQWRSIVVQRKQ